MVSGNNNWEKEKNYSNINGKILIIDDNFEVRKTISDILSGEHYKVFEAENAAQGIAFAEKYKPDMILLDYYLPDKRGDQIIRELEKFCMNIIIMSGIACEKELTDIISKGAIDIYSKPIIPESFLIFIQSRMIFFREFRNKIWKPELHNLLLRNGIVYDPENCLIVLKGKELDLTNTEFRLVALLLEKAGSYVTKEDIMQHIWNDPKCQNNENLRSNILRIRSKLDAIFPGEDLIQSKYNLGYRWKMDSEKN